MGAEDSAGAGGSADDSPGATDSPGEAARAAPTHSQPPPKVLFIAGADRSGSTILSRTLGELPGFYSLGELRFVWKHWLRSEYLCGCGRQFQWCEFWLELRRGLGIGPGGIRASSVLALQLEHVRTRPRALFALWRDVRRGDESASARTYVDLATGLYGEAARETGARVIVDCSKVPADAYALAVLGNLDLRVLHLVRDPRAVAHSWSRRKQIPRHRALGGGVRAEYMRQWSPLRAVAQWLGWNVAADALLRPRLGGRYLRVRYEDFAAAPRETIAAIRRFAGEPPAEDPFVDDRTVLLGRRHSVPGNPNLFAEGEVEIRRDTEWTRALGRRARAQVTLATLPLLRRYGYRLVRPG